MLWQEGLAIAAVKARARLVNVAPVNVPVNECARLAKLMQLTVSD